MDPVNKAGHLMSLAALQQYDPYINKLLDVTGQVALYTFNSKASEWEKTDIEGTLFVYARSASPHHGFTIMNRLSTENLVEPINKDLEFQLQDPFLLYRNANLGIYSIWFYDKTDCQRIAQLMVSIVKQEALMAQQACPDSGMTSRTNGCVDTQSRDILELLNRAKEEYQKIHSGETPDVSANADAGQIQDQLHATVDPPVQEKTTHTIVKQITVEELFGSSLSKDPVSACPPVQNTTDSSPGETFLHANTYVPQSPSLQSLLAPHLTPDSGGTDRPLVPGLAPLLQAGSSMEHHPPSVSPRLVPQAVPDALGSLGTSVSLGLAGPPPTSYITPSKPEAHPLSMPTLAPTFLSSPLVTPQSFRESVPKPPAAFAGIPPNPVQPSKETNVFVQPQNLVKNFPVVSLKAGLVAGTEPSVLLSPSAFQNSVTKTTEPIRNQAQPPSPPANLGPADQGSAPINRNQLQEILIHLIKNDARFLSAIHEAYVHSISKDLANVKL
ncbi:mRNA-decapping enzyme 1A [Denticeps clupeoides]|uniref:5'-(N(7)-methylguanosine 5'-triphospho)-[mRNA] hydrolase n=1 Tax=Denticeps clupeoides TaxID=299321 RepID=A0AAY4AYC1_9TELE|nr:mRNA-decapping enzyme 1A [Denticeps clupeoides]